MNIEEIEKIRRVHANCNCPDCKDIRILLDHISTLEKKVEGLKEEGVEDIRTMNYSLEVALQRALQAESRIKILEVNYSLEVALQRALQAESRIKILEEVKN